MNSAAVPRSADEGVITSLGLEFDGERTAITCCTG